MRFRVPHQAAQPTLAQLLQVAWPEATAAQVKLAIESGGVRVEGRVLKNPRRTLAPDAQVEVGLVQVEEQLGGADAAELARGAGFVVVEKPIGMVGARSDDPMSPVAFLADVLGLDRAEFTPVWTSPSNMGGPWLCAETPERADALRRAIRHGDLHTVWVAITPQFGRPVGELQGDGVRLRYAAVRLNGGLSELQLMPEFDHDEVDISTLPDLMLDLLAARGEAALGDRERGGYMVSGGVRLRLMSLYDDDRLAEGWVPPGDWWPEEPVVARIERAGPPERKPTAIRSFTVSEKTLAVLRAGHPWVLPDRDTSSTDDFEAGELVQLRTPNGAAGPYALIDGFDDVAARIFTDDAEAARDFGEEVVMRVDEAIARRRALFGDLAKTDLFRVVHGEADGLPGLFLDRVGPLYRATLVGATAEPLREPVYQAIEDLEPDAMILEVAHMRDVRQQDELPGARIVVHGAHYVQPGERVIAQEDGLRYWCEPWEGIDTGFFADQRDNRRRVRDHAAPGQRWLNLFCHTGAFSVALVAAGADVVSVDISRRYLQWLDENLSLNGLDLSRNRNLAEDARAALAEDTRYDGIIVDPPTAARSEAGFWSVHKDYEKLLIECFQRLAPGGVMLVCRNSRRRSTPLDRLVRDAAAKARVKLAAVEPAPPSLDYPRLPAFPEGDSFEGVWAQLR